MPRSNEHFDTLSTEMGQRKTKMYRIWCLKNSGVFAPADKEQGRYTVHHHFQMRIKEF